MSFLIKILGANSATPAYGRHTSSQFVSIDDQDFLIDCGEGTQMQLQQFKTKPGKINHIFISHLHGDHYFGIMGLINTFHLSGRKNNLYIYAPPGLDEIITTNLKHARSSLNYKIKFTPLTFEKQTTIFENTNLWVECFPLFHNVPCYGFLIREKPKLRKINKEVLPEGLSREQLIGLKEGKDIYDGQGRLLYQNQNLTLPPKKSRTYAYCSDTCYNENLLVNIKGVDLLYHDATFMEQHAHRAGETGHSTARQAAHLAKLAEAGQLLIGHYSSRYQNLEPMLEEARQIFPPTEMAWEGSCFNIPE